MEAALTNAAHLGISVTFGSVFGAAARPDGEGGVLVCSTCPTARQRVALAFEVGYAFWGAPVTGRTLEDYRRAELYAARMLIDADRYRFAALLVGDDVEKIAEALEVPKRLVEIRRGDFESEADAPSASSLNEWYRLA